MAYSCPNTVILWNCGECCVPSPIPTQDKPQDPVDAKPKLLTLAELVDTARVFPTSVPLKDSSPIYFPFDWGIPEKETVKNSKSLVQEDLKKVEKDEEEFKKWLELFADYDCQSHCCTKKQDPLRKPKMEKLKHHFDVYEHLKKEARFWNCLLNMPDLLERLELFGVQDFYDF